MTWWQQEIFSNFYRKLKSWCDRHNCWYAPSQMKSIWKRRKEITALTGLPIWSSECLWSPVKVSSVGREGLSEHCKEGLPALGRSLFSMSLVLWNTKCLQQSSHPWWWKKLRIYPKVNCRVETKQKSWHSPVCLCVHSCVHSWILVSLASAAQSNLAPGTWFCVWNLLIWGTSPCCSQADSIMLIWVSFKAEQKSLRKEEEAKIC